MMNRNLKKRSPYDDAREILEEQGFFESGDYFDDCFDDEKCAYCGDYITKGQVRAKVFTTGDVIHEDCWRDYAEDNFNELCITSTE